jgi:hypothetical protein
MNNVKVVTLCGSVRFKDQFKEIETKLTLEGTAVFSLCFFEESEGIEVTAEQKKLFGQIHLKKIDLSDEIFVINVDGYIGDSTRKEIAYAIQNNKIVNYYSQ